MSDRPPLAVLEEDDLSLEQLAATAQLLAEKLVIAAQRGSAVRQRSRRLQLVGRSAGKRVGESSLSMLARCYLRARRLREGLFPDGIFADPAWDILLDLFACKLDGKKIGVSNACLAAGVPPTTALRHVNRLEECGLVERVPDSVDNRRIYVELTDIAMCRIELWLKTTFDTEATT